MNIEVPCMVLLRTSAYAHTASKPGSASYTFGRFCLDALSVYICLYWLKDYRKSKGAKLHEVIEVFCFIFTNVSSTLVMICATFIC